MKLFNKNYKVIFYTVTNKFNIKVLTLHINLVEVMNFRILRAFFLQGFEMHVIFFTNEASK